MKLIHHVAAVALALVAVAITVFLWDRGSKPDGPTTPPPTQTTGSARGSANVRAETTTHVRKLSRQDRETLRLQIQAAIARRAAAASTTPTGTAGSGTTPPPTTQELPQLKLEDAGPDLQAALQEAIPQLADCYPAGRLDAGSKRATAMMTMISDPELGTVIDTERVTDESEAALGDALETCMRDAIESLALPGLEKPGALPLQYTFVFD